MSITIRGGVADGAVRVGTWCGGLTLIPDNLAGAYALAATPLYVDRDDLIRLLVYLDGVWASEYLDEATVAHHLRQLGRTHPDDYASRNRDSHDEVMSYWDCQP